MSHGALHTYENEIGHQLMNKTLCSVESQGFNNYITYI